MTLVEVENRFTRIAPIESKHADHVAELHLDALRDLKQEVHNLTLHDFNEFAQHQKAKKRVRANV